MKLETDISNSGLFFLLLLSAVAALVYVLYFFRKNKDEFSRVQRLLLSAIKFLAVFLLSALLLSPIVETVKKRVERPILILAVDNSESMKVDSTNQEVVDQLLADARNLLSNKFNIQTFTFGERLTQTNTPDFTEQKSNYSNLFGELDKQFYNLNVGAMVLIGDGIYNDGKNPGQTLSRLNAPVYTVGIGDTLAKADQAILDVTHNPNVFLNNEFPLEVELNFTDFPEEQTLLSIYMDGKLVKSENVQVAQPNYYYQKTFNIKADKPGLKNVQLALSPLVNEQNKRNNRYNFTIEVHDNKKKILILTQSPHPDIGAIVQTLKTQANLEIQSENVSSFNGSLSDYDLVVLNQLPSLRTQHLPVFAELAQSEVSVLALVGPTTSIAALNNLGLKFHLNPTLTTQESIPYFNEAFSLFSLPAGIQDVEQIYPPLLCHFTEYQLNPDFSILAYQKINGIEMNYPLLIAGNIEGRKIGAVMGEGIWRWRLYEYQNYDNQRVFNQLLINLFNYLSLKEEREQFRIYYDHIFAETSQVKLKAQVFNELYEPVNNAEISLTLTDSTGKALSYLFDANELDYNLNIGYLEPGKYRFEASTKLGDKELSKEGNFSVEEVNIEHHNLQSNFNVLHLISAQTGGRFYSPRDYTQLLDQLEANTAIQSKTHAEKSVHELIDWKWFALLILTLFSLEWFLRKFWGSY